MPISAYDNAKAIDQMEAAYSTLLSRPVFGGTSEVYKEKTRAFSLDGKEHPRIVTLGGDHTIVSSVRCLRDNYSKVIGSSHSQSVAQGVRTRICMFPRPNLSSLKSMIVGRSFTLTLTWILGLQGEPLSRRVSLMDRSLPSLPKKVY